MLQLNWIKVLTVLGVFSSYTLGCYVYGRHSQSVVDNVVALKIQNKTLHAVNINQNAIIEQMQSNLQLAESTNQAIIIERDTIVNEYNYANKNIQKYQKILNTTCSPAALEMRIIQSTESNSTMSKLASMSSGDLQTNINATNSGILQWGIATKEWGMNCMVEHNAMIEYYHKLENNYNH